MKSKDENSYQDMLNLPHHQSADRPHMPLSDRAAQFAPFSALTGYEEAVLEAARYTETPISLSEDQLAILDEKIRLLNICQSQNPEISVTCFIPDEKKEGGRYRTWTGTVKKLDLPGRRLVFEDNTEVLLDCITDLRMEEACEQLTKNPSAYSGKYKK